MFKFTTVRIIRAAVIAAIYFCATFFIAPLSYGPLQIRFSEALTILPALFPEAVIGVTVGCLLANSLNPAGFLWIDAVFGTLATFAAAVCTFYIGKLFGLGYGKSNNDAKPDKAADISIDENSVSKNKKGGVFLAALPPVLINALVIPFIIFAYIYDDMANINIFASNNVILYLLGFTSVLTGQAIAVYGIGVPLYYGLKASARLMR